MARRCSAANNNSLLSAVMRASARCRICQTNFSDAFATHEQADDTASDQLPRPAAASNEKSACDCQIFLQMQAAGYDRQAASEQARKHAERRKR